MTSGPTSSTQAAQLIRARYLQPTIRNKNSSQCSPIRQLHDSPCFPFRRCCRNPFLRRRTTGLQRRFYNIKNNAATKCGSMLAPSHLHAGLDELAQEETSKNADHKSHVIEEVSIAGVPCQPDCGH